jgi:hypothetical protein
MNTRKNTDTKTAVQNKDLSSTARDEVLKRVEKDYEEFKETHTFKFPTWLYEPPKCKLIKVEVEDCPRFGDKDQEQLFLVLICR